ncbi:MAG: hypothetical protein DMF62_09405 [Acidobacteria bacterium]|nr:MAG: hypothetical protein DMF62_09405 [Acidobacteriota bacterium]
MPLSKRARIEVYLPTKNDERYQRLRRAFEVEFLKKFGGCTVIRGAKGLYLNSGGEQEIDNIDVVYADTTLELEENITELSRYTDELKGAVLAATNEESVLLVVHEIYHSV